MTEHEYQRALARVDELMGANADTSRGYAAGLSRAEELASLARIVTAFEYVENAWNEHVILYGTGEYVSMGIIDGKIIKAYEEIRVDKRKRAQVRAWLGKQRG